MNTDLLLQFAFSKKGVAARWVAGVLVGMLVGRLHFSGDASAATSLLTQIIGDTFSALFVLLQLFLNARHRGNVKTVEAALTFIHPEDCQRVDGVITAADIDTAQNLATPAVKSMVARVV